MNTPPSAAPPTDRTKFFSTHVCDCVDDDGNEVTECLGNCWEWQRFDLEESLRPWFFNRPSAWFAISNLVAKNDDGTFTRHSGWARIQFVEEMVDFLIHNCGDFSLLYETPEPDDIEWHFWQDSPHVEGATEDYDWVKCKMFCTQLDDWEWDDLHGAAA